MKFLILCLFALFALLDAQRFEFEKFRDYPRKFDRVKEYKPYRPYRPNANEDLNKIFQKIYEKGVQALGRLDSKLSNTTQEEFNERVQQRFNAAIERAYARNPQSFKGQSLEEVKAEVSQNWESTRESLKDFVKLTREDLLAAMRTAWQKEINETRIEYERTLKRLENDRGIQNLFETISSGVDRFKNRYQNIVKKITELNLDQEEEKPVGDGRFIKLNDDDDDDDDEFY